MNASEAIKQAKNATFEAMDVRRAYSDLGFGACSPRVQPARGYVRNGVYGLMSQEEYAAQQERRNRVGAY